MENRIIAGIKRRKEFSPNHVDNDAAIFALCVENLRINGFQVNLYEEEEFLTADNGEQIIFHMARHHSTLLKLKELEQSGCRVINSTRAIDNCGRLPMTGLFSKADIPQPRTVVISTDSLTPITPFPQLWLKRCDAHTISADDVCFVETEADFNQKLAGFAKRGSTQIVVNEHLEGDLVKFYGVSGTPFFFWFYPYEMNHSKFGQEEVNGEPRKYAFSETEFAKISHSAAHVLQLDIWGGDAIIAPDGKIRIIDFNDFPSFKPCREIAAKAIAGRVMFLSGES
ncbi:hypothetical protein [Parabacteroides sp. FAFU027]|uniref:hypothetical protein n=1 Tax=Parabacteroides sp. FAFU027 TaxID=2922715 RepID=UPI001FAEA97A|nr:hypothetical protein [Parabacteroides sp. FAFU027]